MRGDSKVVPCVALAGLQSCAVNMKPLAVILIGFVCGSFSRGQANGTAVIAGNTKACHTASEAELWLVTSESLESPLGIVQSVTLPRTAALSQSGMPLRSRLVLLAKQPVTSTCTWTFKALQPGDYVVSLKATNGSGGSETFSVKGNGAVQVTIPAPTVAVSGRATSNGKPVSGGEVEFVRFLIPLATPFVRVATDGQGRYTAILDRPGEYDVRLSSSSPRRMVLSERRPLAAGENNIDLSAKQLSDRTTNWIIQASK
jgi:hypothetical protein